MPETHFGISQSLFQAENLVIPGVEMRPLYLKENKENEANIRQSKTNFGLLPGLIGARECRGQPSCASPSWGWTRGWGSSQVPHPYYRLTGWFVWVYRLLVAHESNLHIQGLQCIVQGSRALKYRPYFFQSSEMLDHRKIAIEQNESTKR